VYYYATLAAGRRRIYLSMHLPVYQGVIQQVSINDSVKPARESIQSVSQSEGSLDREMSVVRSAGCIVY